MKLNEVIELNGKEYTVELNRESIIRVNQYANIETTTKKFQKSIIKDKTNMEISDNENPFADVIDEEKLEREIEEKQNTIKKTVTRAFWIWLYPVEKLNITQVEELLEPYFVGTDVEANYLIDKYEEFYMKSIEIRNEYLNESKNLKAQAK